MLRLPGRLLPCRLGVRRRPNGLKNERRDGAPDACDPDRPVRQEAKPVREREVTRDLDVTLEIRIALQAGGTARREHQRDRLSNSDRAVGGL